MCAATDIPKPLLQRKLDLLTRRDTLVELLGSTGTRLPNNTWTKGSGAANEVGRLTRTLTWGDSDIGRKQLMQQAKDAGIDWQDYKDSWELKLNKQLEAARTKSSDYRKRLEAAEKALASFEKDNSAIAALSRHDIEQMLMGSEDNDSLPSTQHATAEATQADSDESVEEFLNTKV